MANILVTGGAGFIGSYVADNLIDQGHNVIILDDLSGGFLRNANDKATFILGTILDTGLLESIFKEYKFDYVYHLAAYAAEGLSHFIKRFNYQNNLIGSVNLINLAVKYEVQCFIYTSSIAVYGDGFFKFNETIKPDPQDSYAIAKASVEKELEISKKMFDLNYIIFRPHNVYGIRQNLSDPYRNVIGIFMRRILEGKPMMIFGDGEQTRSFSHVDNVAETIAFSAFDVRAHNEIFDIGDDTPYTVNSLALMVAEAMVTQPEIVHVEARNEAFHANSSHEKVKEMLSFPESPDLRRELRKVAKWAKQLEIKPPEKFSGIELTKNLPNIWR